MNNEILILGRFTFNVHGLNVTYSHQGQITNLSLCSKATCQLLEDAKLIEGGHSVQIDHLIPLEADHGITLQTDHPFSLQVDHL